MAKNNKSNKSTVVATSNESGTESTIIKTAGRPIDPHSKRQSDLVMKALKGKAGIVVKRGRPIENDSERQQRLAELAEKKAMGLGKPGRPAYSEAEKAAAEVNKKTRGQERMELAMKQADEFLANHPDILEKLQAGEIQDVAAVVEKEITSEVTA